MGGWLAEASPTVISRSQMEQLWPWSPASPSTFFGKTRTMSLERVSTQPSHHRGPVPSLCPVMGKGTLDLRVACVYFHSQRSPPQAPPLLGVGRTPGLRGGAPDER